MTQIDALMKTLNEVKNPTEQLAVIHVMENGQPTTVAFVDVDSSLSVSKKISHAFMKTNSIDDAWWNNEGVTKMFGGDGCRSTSVGDMVLLSNGEKYKVEPVGWTKIE
tara:strand:+ start:197 stop:520 length:324 start_codon:yes stop_codon:yes gene_type:complete